MYSITVKVVVISEQIGGFWYFREESKILNRFWAIIEGIALVDARKIFGGEIGCCKGPVGDENVDLGFCELQCAFDGVAGSCAVDCAYETCFGR